MSKQVIIDGMLINLDYTKPDSNGRMYKTGVFEQALEEYHNRLKLEDRKKKINKICQNLQKNKEKN
jgi:hypothetical protein